MAMFSFLDWLSPAFGSACACWEGLPHTDGLQGQGGSLRFVSLLECRKDSPLWHGLSRISYSQALDTP